MPPDVKRLDMRCKEYCHWLIGHSKPRPFMKLLEILAGKSQHSSAKIHQFSTMWINIATVCLWCFLFSKSLLIANLKWKKLTKKLLIRNLKNKLNDKWPLPSAYAMIVIAGYESSLRSCFPCFHEAPQTTSISIQSALAMDLESISENIHEQAYIGVG